MGESRDISEEGGGVRSAAVDASEFEGASTPLVQLPLSDAEILVSVLLDDNVGLSIRDRMRIGQYLEKEIEQRTAHVHNHQTSTGY